MSQFSSQIKTWMREANKRLLLGRLVDWILCAVFTVTIWGSEGIPTVFVIGLGGSLMVWVSYQLIQTWRRAWTVETVLRFFEAERGMDGLYMTAFAAESGTANGRKNWVNELGKQALQAIQKTPVSLPKWTMPGLGLFLVLPALQILFSIGVYTPPDQPERRTVSEVVVDLSQQEQKLRTAVEQLEATEDAPREVISSLNRVLDAISDLRPSRRSLDIRQIEDAKHAVEGAAPLVGAEAMSSVLAEMGEAAEYSVPETLEHIQSDLADLKEAAQEAEETQKSKRTEPGTNKEPPPDEMKPSDEPGEEPEKGEGEDEVLARAEADGEGQDREGEGKAPSELLDESTLGAGTAQMEGVMGDETVASSPSAAEGGSEESPSDEQASAPIAEEEAWVRAQWDGDAVGLTRAIELMGDGRLPSAQRDTVHRQFAAIAEAALRKDDIPAARAEYIRNYFKILAEEAEK